MNTDFENHFILPNLITDPEYANLWLPLFEPDNFGSYDGQAIVLKIIKSHYEKSKFKEALSKDILFVELGNLTNIKNDFDAAKVFIQNLELPPSKCERAGWRKRLPSSIETERNTALSKS